MTKRRLVPVVEVPITFYMKSTSEVIRIINGFKLIRVISGEHYRYYYQRGKHVWREVQ